MGYIKIGDYFDYLHDQRKQGAPDDGLFEALSHEPLSVRMVYLVMTHFVLETAPDRCVWADNRLIARLAGVHRNQVGKAQERLVALGLIYPWRSPRMKGARHTSYWVRDAVGDAQALALWAGHRFDALVAEIGRDPMAVQLGQSRLEPEAEARLLGQVRQEVAAARAKFAAAYPGHVATDDRILALLTGAQLRVGTTRKEGADTLRGVKAVIREALAAAGVADPQARLDEVLADRRDRDVLVTAKALGRALRDGTLAPELAPLANRTAEQDDVIHVEPDVDAGSLAPVIDLPVTAAGRAADVGAVLANEPEVAVEEPPAWYDEQEPEPAVDPASGLAPVVHLPDTARAYVDSIRAALAADEQVDEAAAPTPATRVVPTTEQNAGAYCRAIAERNASALRARVEPVLAMHRQVLDEIGRHAGLPVTLAAALWLPERKRLETDAGRDLTEGEVAHHLTSVLERCQISPDRVPSWLAA